MDKPKRRLQLVHSMDEASFKQNRRLYERALVKAFVEADEAHADQAFWALVHYEDPPITLAPASGDTSEADQGASHD